MGSITIWSALKFVRTNIKASCTVLNQIGRQWSPSNSVWVRWLSDPNLSLILEVLFLFSPFFSLSLLVALCSLLRGRVGQVSNKGKYWPFFSPNSIVLLFSSDPVLIFFFFRFFSLLSSLLSSRRSGQLSNKARILLI